MRPQSYCPLKPAPHQRRDGSFTQHDYMSWGTDMRHQFSGYTVEAEIFVCVRPMADGSNCGHEKNKPIVR
jgi:hypothetical protein